MIVELVILLLCLWVGYLMVLQKRPRNFPPGPRGIPVVGNLLELGEDSHEGICRIGKKYGKLFSLNFGSFPVVILNNVGVIRKALKTEGFEGRPNFLPLMSLVPGGISFNTGESWKEQRRFALHKLRDYGFGKNSMEGIINREVKELVQYLKNLKGKPLYPRRIYSTSIINSLWSIVGGTTYALEDEKLLEMQNVAVAAFQEPPILGILYFLPLVTKLFPKWTGFSECEKLAKKFLNMVGGIVKENTKTYKRNEERQFIDSYWKKMEETTDKSSSFYKDTGEDNLKATLTALFVAGFDTLSSTLCWATLYLGLYPEKYKKLEEEILTVLGHEDSPSIADLQRMPYTEATMAEILRFSSIIPQALAHSTNRDMEFEGFWIPKGTIVFPNLYGAHMDEKIWGDPRVFRPERFLNSEGKFVKSEAMALMPFGVGKRSCPAEGMAMIEFFFYLTGLVQAFTFKFDEEKHPVPPTTKPLAGMVMQTTPYFVSFIPRKEY